MGNALQYWMQVGKRWMGIVCIGAIICGGGTYLLSTQLRPVYQASTYLIVNVGAEAHPSVTESLQAVPTFAQLITTPSVLVPVAKQHPGLSAQDLQSMLTIKPQANTQIIELDVQAGSPTLAAELVDQVSQSFAAYANTGAPGTVRFLPAQIPTQPLQPRPLEDTSLGTLVGALLMVLFAWCVEWLRNRANSVEQIQELLDMDVMALLPRIPRRKRLAESWRVTAEKYQMICAALNLAQAAQSFKTVLFTSALAGEGKSTIIGQVAMSLAQTGKQVLLVDLNVHRPMLAEHFHLPRHPGLTDLLDQADPHLSIEQYSQDGEVAGLRILAAGSRRMQSAELLQALAETRFLARLQQTSFDYVLLDAPPLFAVADTQMLLPTLDAVVLVVNASRTPRRVLARVRQVLWRVQSTRLLGVIVNQSIWHDSTDARLYALPQPKKQHEARFQIEPVKIDADLQTQETLLLPATIVTSEPAATIPHTQSWDIDENEPVTPEEALATPAYVIRPMLSLNGLNMSSGGLIRRAFSTDVTTPRPFFLQNPPGGEEQEG